MVLVLYSRMAFLQKSALKEALKSFSMLPKGEGMNNLLYGYTRDWMFSVGWFCSFKISSWVARNRAGSHTNGRRSWADSLSAGSNKLVLYL